MTNKNIWILPTENPKRGIVCFNGVNFCIERGLINYPKNLYPKSQGYNIYITSNDDINENDYIITKDGRLVQVSYLLSKDLQGALKVILTTDLELIKDGIQSIPDEFLEWFVKNPSCENVELHKWAEDSKEFGTAYSIIIPQDQHKCTCEVGHPYNNICCKVHGQNLEETSKLNIEHNSKFIVFTLQDGEDWVQHSVPLDSFEIADEFAQQFRDKKLSYLICKTVKQGYNGK